MFISTAQAQTAAAAAPAGLNFESLGQFIPLILVFLVMYFFLMRPQQKKMKEHKAMLESLRRGDKVVTGGGILASVVKVGPDDEVTVDVGDGVKLRVLRSSITNVLAKTEPAGKGGDVKAAKAKGDSDPAA